MADIKHPWQSGPTELISFALEHLHRHEEADQRVAFLLLDVAVETLFKTFLLLPTKTTGAKLSFEERGKAIEAKFPELCEAMERAAGDRLKGIDLTHVRFFHTNRNKLYHEGTGITIPISLVQEYAKLAVDLLNRLLDVDLGDELRKPEIEALRAAEEKAKEEREKREIEEKSAQIEQARRAVAQTAATAIERVYPQLLLPSFSNSFETLRDEARQMKPAGESSPNLEQARAALADVGARQEIRNLGMYSDLTEFYLGLLETIVCSQLATDPSTLKAWFYSYQLAALYPANVDWNIIDYDEKADEPIYDPPTHSQILDQGQEWLKILGAIQGVIVEWSKRPDIAPPPIQKGKAKTRISKAERDRATYNALREWLQARPTGEESLKMKFKEIEEIIGHTLPASAYRHRAWWANHGKNASGAAWLDAGWRVASVDLAAHNVTFRRMNTVLYQEFFTDLLTRLKTERPGVTHASKVFPTNWFWFAAGRSGFNFTWSFGRGDVLRVELIIASQDKAINERAFKGLETQKDEIEKEMGMSLIWEPRPDNLQKLIRVTRHAKITDEPKELEAAKQWATETMVKFTDVFTPRIIKLEY